MGTRITTPRIRRHIVGLWAVKSWVSILLCEVLLTSRYPVKAGTSSLHKKFCIEACRRMLNNSQSSNTAYQGLMDSNSSPLGRSRPLPRLTKFNDHLILPHSRNRDERKTIVQSWEIGTEAQNILSELMYHRAKTLYQALVVHIHKNLRNLLPNHLRLLQDFCTLILYQGLDTQVMMVLTYNRAITGKARTARITAARSNHFPG